MLGGEQKGMMMNWNAFYTVFVIKANSVVFLAVAILAAAAVLPQNAMAHLLQGSRGPVNAFNYADELLPHLNEDCTYSFECRHNDVKNNFLYNCYYDVQSGECQCSKGDFSKCDAGKSSLGPAELARMKSGGMAAFPLSLVEGLAKPVKSLIGWFSSLPLAAKIAAGVIVLIAVVSLFLRLRNSLGNNLRRANALHEEATVLHEKGQEEEAKLMFEKANYYREHAYEQQQKT